MAFLKTWRLSWQLDKHKSQLLYFWQKKSTVTNTTLWTSVFATYGLTFPFSCSRKCLHVSIYILLKQNSIPAASSPKPPQVFQASRPSPASERSPLSQLSLISWDQLVIAADKWLRGQGSCGESLYQAERPRGRRPGNAGVRLPSYWPFTQLSAGNGLLREDLRLARRDATFKRPKKKKRQQCPDTDSGCSIKPSWTDRVQQLTSVFSRKQNKQETYLGGIAVDSCGVSKYADKKQKWCNRNRRRHRNPSLQLRGCTAEELRLRPLQTALTESWNNSPDRNKIGENNHDHRTELIPSKSLHYRQDTHLVTSITIAHRLPRQLVSSSSHFSAPSHAALNINSADNCLETVSAETRCTEQLKDIGPSSKTTGGHDKQREGDRTKVPATVILWLWNFSLQISTFPDPDFTDASAY